MVSNCAVENKKINSEMPRLLIKLRKLIPLIDFNPQGPKIS